MFFYEMVSEMQPQEKTQERLKKRCYTRGSWRQEDSPRAGPGGEAAGVPGGRSQESACLGATASIGASMGKEGR